VINRLGQPTGGGKAEAAISAGDERDLHWVLLFVAGW
jgi:hypothetical protein